METKPIERPVPIDGLLCRLRQDFTHFGRTTTTCTMTELEWLLRIAEAARHCVREWEPNDSDRARGHGTGVGQRAAEDKLIRLIRSERRTDTARAEPGGNHV